MSKIEVTEAQAAKLDEVWRNVGFPATRAEAYTTVANELVAMGLVRPASDDHDAHFKELWESIEGRIKATDDLAARVAALEAYINGDEPGVPPNVRTPDPHAAAKERAKLWGVELVECGTDEMGWGKLMFTTTTHFYDAIKGSPSRSQWIESDGEPISEMHGYYRTPDEAWSNFPTEPPPGWEAKCEHADIVSTTGDTHGQCVKCNQRVPKPRTEADRLGEVAYNEYWADDEVCSWEECHDDTRGQWSTIAHAVRKAVLAAQLEPSEEDRDAALSAWFADGGNDKTAMRAALRAAARVRLEKAEGEAPCDRDSTKADTVKTMGLCDHAGLGNHDRCPKCGAYFP